MVEEIQKQDSRPEWLKINQVTMGIATCRGKTIEYTVLKKDAGPKTTEGTPALPGFMGYHQFPGDNQRRLFISEEVPEEYRNYVLGHEIYEFTELEHSPKKCLEACMWEIAEVPAAIKPEYIRFRHQFFENLVAYNMANLEKEERKDIPNEEKITKQKEFLLHITASRDYLRSLDQNGARRR